MHLLQFGLLFLQRFYYKHTFVFFKKSKYPWSRLLISIKLVILDCLFYRKKNLHSIAVIFTIASKLASTWNGPHQRFSQSQGVLISCFASCLWSSKWVEQNTPSSPQDIAACRANQVGNDGWGEPRTRTCSFEPPLISCPHSAASVHTH